MAHSNNGTISTISKGGYRVEGKVCDVPISFLLDTGAAVTLLRKDAWERVSAGGGVHLSPWSGERLVGVDGSPLQVFGKAEVGLILSGREFRAQALVVSPLTIQAILGLDFLQQNMASIDLGKKQLLMGQERESHIALHQPPQSATHEPGVRLVEAVCIPPYLEVLVLGSTDLEGEEAYLIVGNRSRSGTLVARALVKPEQGRVPVCLLNPRAETVTLKPGSTIATLEAVEPPETATVASVALTYSASPDQERMLWQLVEESGGELMIGEK